MNFKSSDLLAGDRVVWFERDSRVMTLEVVLVHVDHTKMQWTHLCVSNPSRPEYVGEFYTTPGTGTRESWETLWSDALIVSRAHDGT